MLRGEPCLESWLATHLLTVWSRQSSTRLLFIHLSPVFFLATSPLPPIFPLFLLFYKCFSQERILWFGLLIGRSPLQQAGNQTLTFLVINWKTCFLHFFSCSPTCEGLHCSLAHNIKQESCFLVQHLKVGMWKPVGGGRDKEQEERNPATRP